MGGRRLPSLLSLPLSLKKDASLISLSGLIYALFSEKHLTWLVLCKHFCFVGLAGQLKKACLNNSGMGMWEAESEGCPSQGRQAWKNLSTVSTSHLLLSLSQKRRKVAGQAGLERAVATQLVTGAEEAGKIKSFMSPLRQATAALGGDLYGHASAF